LEHAIEQLTKKVPSDFSKIFTLAPTEKNKNRTLLEKHLNDFSARNTFDYFIHKDLGGFLTRELDFYIKNEVLFIDDINTENEQAFTTQLAKIRALKQVANKIIKFLAQLENFQKKLWLKKKFVIKCDYCITLDRIPESYYEEIFKNKAQLDEWKKLFDVSITKLDVLKQEPYLVLDTKFFTQEFKDRILAEFDDLDGQTNGLLINSENFQGIKILSKKYDSQIKVIYIDPPYNTNSTPILYKNEYKHSSWASLLYDRVRASKSLLSDDGVKIVAIDDAEMVNLSKILEEVYSDYRMTRVPVVQNPKGSPTRDFNRVHEYSLFLTPEDGEGYINRTREKNKSPRKMRRWGENSLRIERKLSFYPIYVKDNNITRIGEVPADDFHPKSRNELLESGEIAIYPIDQNGIERRWNFGLDSIEKNLDRITIVDVDNTLDLYLTHEITIPKTVWTGGDYDAGNNGNTLLINILGEKKFEFPKSIKLVDRCIDITTYRNKKSIVLDYFGGSGTTGHSIIKANRKTKFKRKFILMEMGEYFNTVTKPRIQKVIYTDNWKDGRPEDKDGVSQMFKYFSLESYEDTLNNLHLKPNQAQQKLLDTQDDLQEEYLLQYMLDVETRDQLLNLDAFKNPFDYKLNITENNELIPTNVDLVETFNYLIGLHVKRIQRTGAFKTVEGVTNDGDKILVIWRNLEESTNEDLNTFVKKMDYNLRDGEFDTIYVNGDNNLANLRQDEETWKVLLLEEVFFTAMFDVKDV